MGAARGGERPSLPPGAAAHWVRGARDGSDLGTGSRLRGSEFGEDGSLPVESEAPVRKGPPIQGSGPSLQGCGTGQHVESSARIARMWGESGRSRLVQLDVSVAFCLRLNTGLKATFCLQNGSLAKKTGALLLSSVRECRGVKDGRESPAPV